MKNSLYWKDRFLLLEKSLHDYGISTYSKIESTFIAAQKQIQADIDTWIYRIAKNNQVSIVEARRLLNADELAEFRWSVNEYIKYGKENALKQAWMKELENASARVHISRLEALQIRTQHAMEVAFGNQLDEIDIMARTVFSEGYYHGVFELQKGFGFGFPVSNIDEGYLSRIISSPWAPDGSNFSDKVWRYKSQMVSNLHAELTRTALLGASPDTAIKNMSKFVSSKFKNAKSAAGRLVLTEQAFFASASQKEVYKELDVEKYEYVATLDLKTSAVCREMDGRVIEMKNYQPGSTAPPLHPWCRSVTVPYFDDDFSINDVRIARGADGKQYNIPATMKYNEWYDKYIVVE